MKINEGVWQWGRNLQLIQGRTSFLSLQNNFFLIIIIIKNTVKNIP